MRILSCSVFWRMLIPSGARSDRHTQRKTERKRTRDVWQQAAAMESKLPAPPSMRTIASRSRSSSSSTTPLEPSKLPLTARRRSRLQSTEEGDVSSSTSTTSSPEVAIANGAMMAVPPRLELHELTAHGSEHARVASSDANAPGRDVLADAADAFIVQCHQQQLLQATVPRTGIPSLGMQKTHSQSRLTPGSTRLQANGVEKQPSRIGRYEVRPHCVVMVNQASMRVQLSAFVYLLVVAKEVAATASDDRHTLEL